LAIATSELEAHMDLEVAVKWPFPSPAGFEVQMDPAVDAN